MYGAHTNSYRHKLDLAVKGQMSMYDHHFTNSGTSPVSDDLCKVSAKRHPRFWRFLKVLPYMGMVAILVNGQQLHVVQQSFILLLQGGSK